VQQTTEAGESDGNERNAECEKSLDVQKTRVLSIGGVGDTGLEQKQQSSTFGELAKCAAPGAALGPDCGLFDTDLATLIEAWPTLPEAVRAAIVAMVRQARQVAPADEE
jgi:hypothetical protein